MMRWKVTLLTILFFWMIPVVSFAQAYEADASMLHLQTTEKGELNVREHITYTSKEAVDGVLWGYPQIEDAAFQQVKAFVGKKEVPMKVRKDDPSLFYIEVPMKEGQTEIVEVTYQLDGYLTKYEDGTLVRLPFTPKEHTVFQSNSVAVKVIPPKETSWPKVYGSGVAANIGEVDKVGTVTYQLGRLAPTTTGVVEVVYDNDLFPLMKTTTETILPALEKIVETEREQEAQYEANRKKWKTASYIGLPIGLALLLFLMRQSERRSFRLRASLAREIEREDFHIPDETMSLPATIYYLNGRRLTERLLTVSFLQLYRRGLIVSTEDGFYMQPNSTTTRFERALLDYLFAGKQDDETMTLQDVARRLQIEREERHVRSLLASMIAALEEEEMYAQFASPNKMMRRLLGGLSIVSLLGMFFLFSHSLFLLSLLALLLGAISGALALFYMPRNEQGERFFTEWMILSRYDVSQLQNESRWSTLPERDRLRALLFLYGMSEEKGCTEGELEETINTYIPLPVSEVHTYWTEGLYEIAQKMTKKKRD